MTLHLIARASCLQRHDTLSAISDVSAVFKTGIGNTGPVDSVDADTVADRLVDEPLFRESILIVVLVTSSDQSISPAV